MTDVSLDIDDNDDEETFESVVVWLVLSEQWILSHQMNSSV